MPKAISSIDVTVVKQYGNDMVKMKYIDFVSILTERGFKSGENPHDKRAFLTERFTAFCSLSESGINQENLSEGRLSDGNRGGKNLV